MLNNKTQINEWAAYLAIFNGGACRSELLKVARAMRDGGNLNAALLNLGIATPSQKKEIKSRWAAINATTDAECRLHCQFEGLPTL